MRPIPTPNRILLIRPSALGDVCRTVPLIASLKAAYPDAQIDWLVQEGFEDAIKAHPALNAAIPFPRKRLALSKLLRSSAARNEFHALRRRLREPNYDLVIDAQGLARSAIFARLTAAPTRIGHADAREFGALPMTHRVPSTSTHTVDRMLDLLTPLNIPILRDMRLTTPPQAAAHLATLIPGPPPIVIAPTSRWPGKRWPIASFTALTEALLNNSPHPIAIVAAASEHDQVAPLLDHFADNPRIINLLGKTTVGSLLAVIEHAPLVVANDSAALHIAVGFDRPLLALFGPTRTDTVGPYQRPHDVLQAAPPPAGATHKDDVLGTRLMSAITPQSAIEAALERLQ